MHFPLLSLACLLVPSAAAVSPIPKSQGVSVERFDTNPLVSVESVTRETALNLDRPGPAAPFVSFAGPSVVRMPDWITDAPGRYAMYFAHHKGGHIRAAFADDVRGPWTIYAPGDGVLHLNEFEGLIEDHIASPDVHVDHARRRLVMYFHGPLAGADFDQRTFAATSADGRHFQLVSSEDLGDPYFRVFWHRGFAYSPARLGPFARSRDGLTNFVTGPSLFDTQARHYACVPWNDELFVFLSRKGHAPERIILRTISLADPNRPGLGLDWSHWTLSARREVLAPTEPYEMMPAPRTLDPAVFFDVDGRAYLFYCGGHEQTINGAELFVDEWARLGLRNVRCASGAPIGLAASAAEVGALPWLGSEAKITALPRSLLRAKMLQTDPGDVRSQAAAESFIRFEVSHPATVSIAHHSAGLGAPLWLSEWTQTGGVVAIEDPRGPALPQRTLQLYERDFEPGEVALGGNLPRDTPFGVDSVMYGVFVRERR